MESPFQESNLGRRIHAGGIGASGVDDAAAVGHFVFTRILNGVVVIERVNQTKVENQFVQDGDQILVTICEEEEEAGEEHELLLLKITRNSPIIDCSELAGASPGILNF